MAANNKSDRLFVLESQKRNFSKQPTAREVSFIFSIII